MLQHPTIDRLRELGLEGMAKSLRDLAANPETKALDHLEWLGILLEHETTRRQQKRFEARNGGRHQIGTGGRLTFGMTGRHHRNPHLEHRAQHRYRAVLRRWAFRPYIRAPQLQSALRPVSHNGKG